MSRGAPSPDNGVGARMTFVPGQLILTSAVALLSEFVFLHEARTLYRLVFLRVRTPFFPTQLFSRDSRRPLTTPRALSGPWVDLVSRLLMARRLLPRRSRPVDTALSLGSNK